MVVSASDLVLVGCQYHAEDDSSVQGGSIDKGKLLYFSTADISAVDEIEVSASATITASFTIYGKSAVGADINETVSYSSESGVKTTTATFERVTKVVIASGSLPASVTVTFRKESDDVEILKLYGSSVSPSGTAITEVRKAFLNAVIPATGSNTYYEKLGYLNAHATEALNSPVVKEYADPTGFFTFGIETTVDSPQSTANRLTAPTGVTFDNSDKSLGTTLNAGEAIPVWLKLVAASGSSPQKTFVTPRLEGSTV